MPRRTLAHISPIPRRLASIWLPLAFGACAQPPAAVPPAPPAPPPTGPEAQVVNATILANGCQELGRANAHLAEQAMYQLVEGCTSVPGGSVQFVASLQPGGRIEITGAKGQPDVIPICVLKHSLQHKVALAKPCRLDVKLEQSSMSLFVDAGAR